jgi:hypothetical protein
MNIPGIFGTNTMDLPTLLGLLSAPDGGKTNSYFDLDDCLRQLLKFSRIKCNRSANFLLIHTDRSVSGRQLFWE